MFCIQFSSLTIIYFIEYGRAIRCDETDSGPLRGLGATGGDTGPPTLVGAEGTDLELARERAKDAETEGTANDDMAWAETTAPAAAAEATTTESVGVTDVLHRRDTAGPPLRGGVLGLDGKDGGGPGHLPGQGRQAPDRENPMQGEGREVVLPPPWWEQRRRRGL